MRLVEALEQNGKLETPTTDDTWGLSSYTQVEGESQKKAEKEQTNN